MHTGILANRITAGRDTEGSKEHPLMPYCLLNKIFKPKVEGKLHSHPLPKNKCDSVSSILPSFKPEFLCFRKRTDTLIECLSLF